MKKIKYLFCIVLVLIILLFVFIKQDNIENSIVFIESSNNEYSSSGMGVVYKIENDINYIITNYHVIDNFQNVYVYNLNNEKIKAEVVNYDTYTDLALLKIEDRLNLKETNMVKRSVKENDTIYYFNIANNILDRGKVLDLNKEIFLSTDYGNSYYEGNLIEGNIENGNSGGPVLNKKNEVIGLISLKETDKNTAIYIPIENVMEIVTKLKNHTLERLNLGATFVSVNNKNVLNKYNLNIELSKGVVILDLVKTYPLEANGFEVGDIIISINNIEVDNVSKLQNIIYNLDCNEEINVKYCRNDSCDEIFLDLSKY